MSFNIFNIKSEADFQAACLETFLYQYENVEVYRKFVDFLGKKPSEIKEIKDIPFLPIEMFKNHLVLDKVFDSAQTDTFTELLFLHVKFLVRRWLNLRW